MSIFENPAMVISKLANSSFDRKFHLKKNNFTNN